eukprot:TRINITY_DN9786_c0_g3_i1.p1 TRINITY_DN9786_c0_g3~~TRINITY_DN9786_c0_g3_i1.p1  ORF type:complete len:533 (-),score=78.51 TRINITY_DN9786_c0_g3_i1:632-2182(-)
MAPKDGSSSVARACPRDMLSAVAPRLGAADDLPQTSSFRARLASLADEHEALLASCAHLLRTQRDDDVGRMRAGAGALETPIGLEGCRRGQFPHPPPPRVPSPPVSPDFDDTHFSYAVHDVITPVSCTVEKQVNELPTPARFATEPWKSGRSNVSEARLFTSERRGAYSRNAQASRMNTFRNTRENAAKCARSLQRLGMLEVLEESGDSPKFVTDSEDIELDRRVMQLWEVFQELDCDCRGELSAEDLHSYYQAPNLSEEDLRKRLRTFRDAIEGYNKVAKMLHPDRCAEEPSDVVTFTTFIEMMSLSDVDDELGKELACSITAIREMFAMDDATNQIAQIIRIRAEEIGANMDKKSKFLRHLDSVSGVVILLNAAIIGVSTDHSPEWWGWKLTEVFFSVFFVFELLTKIRLFGCKTYWLGSEWHWNCFDGLVVGMALLGLVAFVPGLGDLDVGNLTLVRLMRVARITRVLRLLQLRAFRELLLIVNGVLAGMRTLLWTMILLLAVVYVLGESGVL